MQKTYLRQGKIRLLVDSERADYWLELMGRGAFKVEDDTAFFGPFLEEERIEADD